MFASLERRDGEPVAYVFGPAVTDEGALDVRQGRLTVGLFMIRQGVGLHALQFENPDTRERLTLGVPQTGRDLLTDGYAENASLEVML